MTGLSAHRQTMYMKAPFFLSRQPVSEYDRSFWAYRHEVLMVSYAFSGSHTDTLPLAAEKSALPSAPTVTAS